MRNKNKEKMNKNCKFWNKKNKKQKNLMTKL